MRLVPRAAWGARPPKSTTSIGSVSGAGFHYEGPKMGSFVHDKCASKVRGIQAFHMDSRGWADIAYNALVCPHGYVFEGRGVGRRSAANGTNDGNAHWYAICGLMGAGDPLTDDMKVAYLDAKTWLGGGPQIRPHSSFKATACPGDPVRDWIAAGCPRPGNAPPAPPPPPPAPTPGAVAKHEFFAYDPAFFGGADPELADINGDGELELVTGAGPGGGPHVKILTLDGKLLGGFFAYDSSFGGGLSVSVGDIDGDGRLEIVTGAGPGGGPHVKVWRVVDEWSAEYLGGFFAYSSNMNTGVKVTVKDGLIATGPGPGGGAHIRVFDRTAWF